MVLVFGVVVCQPIFGFGLHVPTNHLHVGGKKAARPRPDIIRRELIATKPWEDPGVHMCVYVCECVLSKKSAGHISWSSFIMQIIHTHWWEVSSTQEFGATTFFFRDEISRYLYLLPIVLFLMIFSFGGFAMAYLQ